MRTSRKNLILLINELINSHLEDISIKSLKKENLKLSENRQLILGGQMTRQRIEVVSNFLLILGSNDDEPITLFINSDGGDFDAALNLCDIIENLMAPVHGIVTGIAFSSAFHTLQSCKQRSAYAHAILGFHGPIPSRFPIDNLEFAKHLKSITKEHHRLMRKIQKRSGQPYSLIKEWSMDEEEFHAQEALSLHFIDNIIALKK